MAHFLFGKLQCKAIIGKVIGILSNIQVAIIQVAITQVANIQVANIRAANIRAANIQADGSW